MKKTTRRKVLAFVLAFGMLFSTVFGTTPLGIFAGSSDADVEQTADNGDVVSTETTTAEEAIASTETMESDDTTEMSTEIPVTEAETTEAGQTAEEPVITTEEAAGKPEDASEDRIEEEETEIPLTVFSAEGSETVEGALTLEGSTVAGSIKVEVTLANGSPLVEGTKYGVDQMFEATMSYVLLNKFVGNQADKNKMYYFTYQMPDNISIASTQAMSGNLNGKADGSEGTYTVSQDGLVTFAIPGSYLHKESTVTGTFTYRFTADEDKINNNNQLNLNFPGTADSTTVTFSEPDVKYGDKSCWNDSNGNLYYSIVVETNGRTAETLRIEDKPGSNLEIVSDSIKLNGQNVTAVVNGDGSFSIDLSNVPPNARNQITYTATIKDPTLDNNGDGRVDNIDNEAKWSVNGQPAGSDKNLPYIEVAAVKANKTGSVNGQSINWTVNINTSAFKQDVSGYTYTDTMTSAMTDKDGQSGSKKQQFVLGSLKITCEGQDVTNSCTVNNFSDSTNSFTVKLPDDAGAKQYTITYTTSMDTDLDIGESISVTNQGDFGKDTVHVPVENTQKITREEKIGVQKSAVGQFDTNTMTQKWSTTITPDVNGMTDPQFHDIIQNAGIGWSGEYVGSTFDEASVMITDESGIPLGADKYEIRFSKSSSAQSQDAPGNDIMDISFKGTFNAPIRISYATVDDGSKAADGKNIYNTSIVNDTQVSSASVWYSYQKGNDQYIYKVAEEPVYDKEKGAYIVTWNIFANTNPENWPGEGLLELKNKEFTVVENLPEGMEYLDTTAVTYWVKGNDDSWNKHSYPMPLIGGKPTEEGQKVTYKMDGSEFDKYNFNPYIQITFRTIVTSLNKELLNEAGFSVEGEQMGQAQKNITVKDKLLDKSASINSEETLLNYTIVVNPNGVTYNEGNALTLTDNIPSNVTLDLNSIRIVGEDGKSIADANWAYAQTQRVLTLTIPDATKATVTYTVQPNLKDLNKDNDGRYDVTVTNAVHFAGRVNQAEDIETWHGKMSESQGTIQGDTDCITIKKIDGDDSKSLSGAHYKLYRFILKNPANASEGGDFEEKRQGDTGDDGTLKFSQLDKDAVYYYVETAAPVGYKLDATKHYFCIRSQGESYQTVLDALQYAEPAVDSDKVSIITGGDEFEEKNYKSTNAAIQIEAWKTLDGSIDQLSLHEFSFTLTEVADANGTDMPGAHTETVKCRSIDGKIRFTPIEYDAVGTHYYKLVEVKGNNDDINYDSSVHIVRIDVTEKDYKLQAAITSPAGNIVFKNTTKPKGSLTFTKEITGLSAVIEDDVWKNIIFTLNDGSTQTMIDKSKFTKNAAGIYTCTIDNLDLDKTYTVTETNYRQDGYTTAVTYQAGVDQVTNGSNTVAKVTLTADNTTGKLAIKNAYTEHKGNLSLTKTFANNVDNQDKILQKDIIFTITGPNGYYAAYTIGDTSTNPHFEVIGNTYTLSIEDLPIGDYTITETNYNVDNYDCTISKKVDGVDKGSAADIKVKINNEATTNVAYTNTYKQHLGYIQVSKKIVKGAGAESLSWEDDIKDTIIFKLIDSDGKEIQGISGSDLMSNGTDEYVSPRYPVPVGKYVVVETLGKIDNVGVTPTYTVNGTPVPGHSERVTVTLTKDANYSVVCSNEYTSGTDFKISKKTITGQDELPGATLTIQKKNADGSWEEIRNWVSTDAAREFSLPAGDYKLIEVTAPKGYAVAEKIEFTVTADKKIIIGGTEQADKIITMRDKPFAVNVNKLKVGGAEELAGAVIKIFDATDASAIDAGGKVLNESKALDTWQSKVGETHDFGKVLRAGGTYWLVETGAPKGYAYSESVKFTVGANGVITVQNVGVENQAGLADADSIVNSITMRDQAFSFRVSKKDLDAGNEISGAKIAVYEAKDISATGTVNVGATPVAEWTSDGNTKDFGPDLLADKRYVLVETGAPQGYAYAANIPFTIKADGTIEVDASVKDANGVVIVKDKALHVNVNKTDLVDGTEVEGAVISIYNKADVDTNGNPTGTALKQWTSKAGEIVDFGDVVKAGQSYVLIETTVAEGYQKAENIEFTVNRDGTLKIGGQYLGLEGKIIYMKDAPEGLELGQLTITKQIKGQVNEEELKGNLTFTITDTATNTVVREYKLDVFTYENGIYTLTITDLPAGSYVVEEKTYLVEGKPCVVKYSVNSAPQVVGTKTSEIAISELTPQTVAYENDYSNDTGKLVITKTIEGDVTKEEAEGALRFKVTKPDGTFVEYTLKDFDSYNETTKTWTKTLDQLEAGNYTVEETVYTLDGRTVSVTYDVNGGGAQTGTAAAAGVADGQVTKVDFKDVYTKTVSKLLITKKIKGDVTKEEAEGALTFEVRENATGKTTTYTLKDFTYNAETDKYTLELNVVPGGYTVTETTKDIDGYECKVTYKVDSGKKKNGDSASVTVSEGAVVTVAFEDTYTDTEETTDETTEEATDTTEDSTADSAGRKDKNPKTGDNTPIAASIMLMTVAAGAMPIAACIRKKKDEEEEE